MDEDYPLQRNENQLWVKTLLYKLKYELSLITIIRNIFGIRKALLFVSYLPLVIFTGKNMTAFEAMGRCETNIMGRRIIFEHPDPRFIEEIIVQKCYNPESKLEISSSDVVLPPKWAESVVKCFEDDQVIGMTGPAYLLWGEENMDWLPEEFYWLISCTAWNEFKDPSDVRSACGMNMAFRREAFEMTGGLPIGSGFYKAIAEDLAFSLEPKKKTRKRIVFDKSAFVWHRVHSYRFNWSYVAARSRHIGTSRYIIGKLYRIKMDRESNLLSRIIRNLPTRITRGRDSVKILRLGGLHGIQCRNWTSRADISW